MTLAVTHQDVAADAATVDSASLSPSQLEMMRAFFCYEFEVARLDRDSVPTATTEAVAEWIEALEMSGLFAPAELRTMSGAWLSEPDALIALLVGDVDEIAARREVADSAPEDHAPEEHADASLLRAS